MVVPVRAFEIRHLTNDELARGDLVANVLEESLASVFVSFARGFGHWLLIVARGRFLKSVLVAARATGRCSSSRRCWKRWKRASIRVLRRQDIEMLDRRLHATLRSVQTRVRREIPSEFDKCIAGGLRLALVETVPRGE